MEPGGETHLPLHLSVRQTAMAWGASGFDNVAGLHFEITNRGAGPLLDVYVGLYADLDSRLRSDRLGHLNDRVKREGVLSPPVNEGTLAFTAGSVPFRRPCVSQIAGEYVCLYDGVASSGLPTVAVLPLDHTTDPLALIPEGQLYAAAPGGVSFRSSAFLPPASSAVGPAPILDPERYDALRGARQNAPLDALGDYSTLVSCGPFQMRPGTTIEFTAALIAGPNPDSVRETAKRLLVMYHGVTMNLLPDSLPASERDQYRSGATGTFGHEGCVEPPPGVVFVHDPHCTDLLNEALPDLRLPPDPTVYRYGHCVWTNADCNWCTGINGNETRVHWLDPGATAPAPLQRATAGDHAVRVEWDNLPEVLFASGHLGPLVKRVVGYRVYKLYDWRNRESLLPPRRNWALARAFSMMPGDTSNGEEPLSAVTDSALDYAEILYEQKHYGIGRYAYSDSQVHDGFDYIFRITTVVEVEVSTPGGVRPTRLEGSISASFDDLVVPAAQARKSASQVWVVPNPYRARADWERPPIVGDPFTRHIDFMGLPQARCTIKIWTLAGDFVAQVDHDGRSGNGEASWNLISRNGQDIESGIYLFTVDSSIGHTVGRFVVIR